MSDDQNTDEQEANGATGANEDGQDRKPWHRQPDETARDYTFFREWLRMGSEEQDPNAIKKRSCRRFEKYLKRRHEEDPSVPVLHRDAINRMQQRNNWDERADAYDAFETEMEVTAKTDAIEQARQKILDNMDDLVGKLIEIGVTGEGKRQQVQAIKTALDRGGLQKVDRVHITGDHQGGDTTNNVLQIDGEGVSQLLGTLADAGALDALTGQSDEDEPEVIDVTPSESSDDGSPDDSSE